MQGSETCLRMPVGFASSGATWGLEEKQGKGTSLGKRKPLSLHALWALGSCPGFFFVVVFLIFFFNF